MNIFGRTLTVVESGPPRCVTVPVQAEGEGFAPLLPAGSVFGNAAMLISQRRPS